MPEMDGDCAAKHIRSSNTGEFDPQIPIIAMTAHALTGDKERFLATGMNGYVAKPINEEELFLAIATVTKEHALNANFICEETSITPEGPAIDFQWLEYQYKGKPYILKTLQEVYAEELPKRLSEIHQKFENKLFSELSTTAHALKGASSLVGASALREISLILELASRDQDTRTCKSTIESLEIAVHDYFAQARTFKIGPN